GLVDQELAAGRSRAPGRGSKTVGVQDAPDRARRDAQAELQQLAGDPRVTPARVLPGKAQHQLADAIIDRRTTDAAPWSCPFLTHEFPVPAQERLWRHNQAASA